MKNAGNVLFKNITEKGMANMKNRWKDATPLWKIASIASILVSVSVIVLAVLQLFDLWADAGYVYVPLMGISLLLQAYAQWKPNRDVAIVNLCAAIIVLICAVVVYTI